MTITRAFDTAWDRTMVILFQPFDLRKWFVIGFAAFLANFLEGGNGGGGSGSSPNAKFNNSFKADGTGLDFGVPNSNEHYHLDFTNGMELLVAGAILFFLMIILLVVAVALIWLGSRGIFVFLDNIVRNRAVLSWPWNAYHRQANSLFYLLVGFLVVQFSFLLLFIVVAAVTALPFFQQHHLPHGTEWIPLAVEGAFYLGLTLVIELVRFLLLELGVPQMFRNGLSAWTALQRTIALTIRYPGRVILFLILRWVLALAAIIMGVLVCCGTCCIGALPYIGTVLMLPVIIYIRCFTLEYLAQFGPEYDIWTVDVT